jgi:membrane protein YqaA with SNARE-associated domain
VALPTFLFTAGRVRRMLAAEPARRGSPTRKWLTWIALFVAVVFLVGDLVTLVYWALGGELTVRFLLKVAIVATIAGSIFGYYLADLRRDDRPA